MIGPELRPRGLSNCLWACATLRATEHGHDLAQALRTPGLVSKMNGQDVSQTAWALQRINATALLPLLRGSIHKVCEEFKIPDLANTATAYAGVSHCCPQHSPGASSSTSDPNTEQKCVWHSLAEAAKSRLPWFTAHDLSVIWWSAATSLRTAKQQQVHFCGSYKVFEDVFLDLFIDKVSKEVNELDIAQIWQAYAVFSVDLAGSDNETTRTKCRRIGELLLARTNNLIRGSHPTGLANIGTAVAVCFCDK
jgi:hypothetical protein